MENHQQSSILKWFKKYILMRDLKEKSPEVLSGCIKLLVIPFLVIYVIWVGMFINSYAHDFNRLEALDGVINIHHYAQKHGKYTKEPVMDLHVVSESKDVIYYLSPLYQSDPLFINSAKIEGQHVRVWYLPDNSKFYLIKFLQTSKFNNSFVAVKKTKSELIHESIYYKILYPLKSMLIALVMIIIQLLFIRFEIFRNYSLYFIDQKWDWKCPIKGVITARFVIVFMLLLIWPYFLIFGYL